MGLIVKNIRKMFGRKVALENVNLDIETGSFMTLLGATGAGKTTLLRIMAGIEKPDEGKVFYDGVDVTNTPVRERNIAMVYQQFFNYPSFSVYENIASPLRVRERNLSEKEINEKVMHIAKLLRLTHILDHYPQAISGGERQRTAIARALVKGTRFIFLDEPLANLDYKLREELRGEFKTFFKDFTIIYATPEPGEAIALSSHVAFLHNGRIIESGPQAEVYNRPTYVEVASYFNTPPMNVLDCEHVVSNDNHYLRLSKEIQLKANAVRDQISSLKEVCLAIRPQDITVSRHAGKDIGIHAVVEFNEIVGSNTTVYFDHQGKMMRMLVQKPVKYKAGSEMTYYLNPEKIFVYNKNTSKIITKGI
jgi:glycerol transport system ATP-binding protein